MKIQILFSRKNNKNTTVEAELNYVVSFLVTDYLYAGVQYTSECFCGNSYGKYGSLPESSCNMPCSGNKTQICGGTWSNSVYKAQ